METKTNFFTQIQSLLDIGLDLTITLRKDGDRIVVGVRPNYGKAPDSPIKPLMLIHPAAALDESFFETISQPMNNYRSFAESVETFNKEVEEAKKTQANKKKPAAPATKSSSSSSSSKKKSTPAKKAAPAKPAAKPAAPAKPAMSKEDKEAAEKAKQDKIVLDYIAKAEGQASAGKYKDALVNLDKALKIKRDPAMVTERDRIERLMNDAKIAVEIKPLLVKAHELKNKFSFNELGKVLKQIFAKAPDNVEAGEIRADLVTRLGEEGVKTIMK